MKSEKPTALPTRVGEMATLIDAAGGRLRALFLLSF